jgi:hypothetical protein
MDMFRVSQHVEDELHTFLELVCPSVIVLGSQMLKKSIEISSILIKKEKIEKEKTKELQSKVKENIMLQIVKKETVELPKIKNHQDENIITFFVFLI